MQTKIAHLVALASKKFKFFRSSSILSIRMCWTFTAPRNDWELNWTAPSMKGRQPGAETNVEPRLC